MYTYIIYIYIYIYIYIITVCLTWFLRYLQLTTKPTFNKTAYEKPS